VNISQPKQRSEKFDDDNDNNNNNNNTYIHTYIIVENNERNIKALPLLTFPVMVSTQSNCVISVTDLVTRNNT